MQYRALSKFIVMTGADTVFESRRGKIHSMCDGWIEARSTENHVLLL